MYLVQEEERTLMNQLFQLSAITLPFDDSNNHIPIDLINQMEFDTSETEFKTASNTSTNLLTERPIVADDDDSASEVESLVLGIRCFKCKAVKISFRKFGVGKLLCSDCSHTLAIN